MVMLSSQYKGGKSDSWEQNTEALMHSLPHQIHMGTY